MKVITLTVRDYSIDMDVLRRLEFRLAALGIIVRFNLILINDRKGTRSS